MYAVIETGGKQYRVEVGTELEVELLEVSPGDAITLDRVLLVADGEVAAIGRPLVENASVAAQVVRQTRGEKLINFKYGPKTRRRVKKGHRQELTVLRISDIVLDGRSAAADAAKAAEARLTERQRLEEAARRQAAADAALAAKLKPAVPGPQAAVKAAKAPKATKAAPASEAAAKAPKATKAVKATKTAPPATKAAVKTTKPTAARASASGGDAPAEKPKRARAAKKDG
jgi:large subunit ribosomal protein L21